MRVEQLRFPVRVETHGQLERVRFIRNVCREWMTHHTQYIGPAEQSAWWHREDPELWLFDYLGYAHISRRNLRRWISLGVLPEARGKGLGTRIYSSFDDVWAEIRSDNVASRRAAEKAGYKLMSEGDGLVVMRG